MTDCSIVPIKAEQLLPQYLNPAINSIFLDAKYRVKRELTGIELVKGEEMFILKGTYDR